MIIYKAKQLKRTWTSTWFFEGAAGGCLRENLNVLQVEIEAVIRGVGDFHKLEDEIRSTSKRKLRIARLVCEYPGGSEVEFAAICSIGQYVRCPQ